MNIQKEHLYLFPGFRINIYKPKLGKMKSKDFTNPNRNYTNNKISQHFDLYIKFQAISAFIIFTIFLL